MEKDNAWFVRLAVLRVRTASSMPSRWHGISSKGFLGLYKFHMSYSLNSLKGGYIGIFLGDYYRVY